MSSLYEQGERLISQSQRILRRDVQAALNEADFNLAVRRAQEAVELALKGGLKMIGVDYPKVHDIAPVLSSQLRHKGVDVPADLLRRIEAVSQWLAEARAPAFYMEHQYSEEDARRAADDAEFVVTQIKKILGVDPGHAG